MVDVCTWEAHGTISQSTYKTGSRGNGYWILLIRQESGDLCVYVHDVELQRVAENLALGSRVAISGVVEPHARFNQVEKPYFLKPLKISIEQN